MLKNKSRIIAILTLIVLALTIPIVRAENETPEEVTSPTTEVINEKAPDGVTNPEDDPEQTTNPGTTTTTDDNTFKKNDVYLSGDNVTVDYIVDGNLFIVANHVTINSQIGGDAFICANSITIGEQGYIFSNLFAFSKDIHIAGVVYDLYAATRNVTITGYVYRDVHVGANTVNIFGTVGRNAFVDCATFNLVENTQENAESKQGSINGNLKYSANSEASIPEGSVSGETNFNLQNAFNQNVVTEKIMNLGTFVITIVAVWLVCLWLAPKFLKNTTTLLTSKKVLPVIGLGILTPIVAILATVLFFVLGITAPLSLLLILISIILMAISTAIFSITLNQIICKKLKIEKTLGIFGMLVVCSIFLWLIGLIPFVGSVLGLIVVILGLGIIVSSLVLKKE